MNEIRKIARGNRFLWPDTSCDLESLVKMDDRSEIIPAELHEEGGIAMFKCRKTGIRSAFFTLVLENYDPDEFPRRGRILIEFGESSPEDKLPGVSPRFWRGISVAMGIASLAIILYWLLIR
jgi:hypothetical protein